MSTIFFELRQLGIAEISDGASLDTILLEEEMKLFNKNTDLSNLKTIHLTTKFLRKYVPHFMTVSSRYNRDEIKKTLDKYPDINSPCSMRIDSTDELLGYMSIAYQVSHFHYILGKKFDMNSSFPDDCCGISGMNLALSLMEHGLPNAAYTFSKTAGHGYPLLPFVFPKKNIFGAIIIEPTNDQLWDDGRRNAVFLKLGKKWEYKTEWNNGASLFPERICSIDVRRRLICEFDYGKYHQDAESFFREAFSNPIDVKKYNQV